MFVSLAIFSVIVFLLVPRFAKWAFRYIEDDKYAHYILVLMFLFICSALAMLAGLEPIIGAFAAGLTLNKLIPHGSPLMNRIDYVGNSLFIPIFLISVGMIVDLRIVLNGTQTIVVAFGLTLVALLGKWLAAFVTQKILKYSLPQRNVMFGLSSAHAAATLAIILVGFNSGILDEYILNGTIVLILVTCVISSLSTDKAARKIIAEEENIPLSEADMGNYAQEKILVPIANPSSIGRHVELAYLIKDKKSANSVSLLGVLKNNDEAEQNILKFRKTLSDYVANVNASEINVDILTTIDYRVASGIARVARETMTDIVIIGWPDKNYTGGKVLTDTIDAVIKTMDKNLFVCNVEKTMIEDKRIVVVSPPLTEKEDGFKVWVRKIVQLGEQLSLPIVHIGHPKTQEILRSHKELKANISFVEFNNWTDPLSCVAEVKKDDLIVLVSAHPGYISHLPALDNLPTRVEEKFPHNNRIVIFPKKFEPHQLIESSETIFAP